MRFVVYVSFASLMLSACSTDYRAVYQNVNAESKWDDSGSVVLNSSGELLPMFIVRDDQLYLKIRENRSEWYFHTVVEYPPWNRAEVVRLLEQHNELISLFPVDWNDWLPKGYGDECKPGQPAAY